MSDFDKIGQALNGIINGIQNQRTWNKAGLAALRFIKKRTRQGKDVHGKTFKPYSADYKKKREKADLPTHIVNLEFDDIEGMLSKADHVVFANLEGVELDILDDEKRQIGYYHNVAGAGKSKVIREFWGLDKKEEKDIQGIIEDDLNIIINRLTN